MNTAFDISSSEGIERVKPNQVSQPDYSRGEPMFVYVGHCLRVCRLEIWCWTRIQSHIHSITHPYAIIQSIPLLELGEFLSSGQEKMERLHRFLSLTSLYQVRNYRMSIFLSKRVASRMEKVVAAHCKNHTCLSEINWNTLLPLVNM